MLGAGRGDGYSILDIFEALRQDEAVGDQLYLSKASLADFVEGLIGEGDASVMRKGKTILICVPHH